MNLLILASFSLTIINIPEIPSIKLCNASVMMAREFEINPIIMLNIANKRLIRINKKPALKIT